MINKLSFTIQADTLSQAHDLIVVRCNKWFGSQPWAYDTYASPLVVAMGGEVLLYEVTVEAQAIKST